MKMLAALVVVLAVAHAMPMEVKFDQFMATYNKNYASTEERARRFEIFQKNLLIAAERDAADETASHGVTQFSDLTEQEFKQYLGYLGPQRVPGDAENVVVLDENVAVPASIDWRTKGAVTPVKNQGQCGSCWAFSATEEIESGLFVNAGQPLRVLSPQQIVSCDTTDYGCGGGWTYDAYAYVEKAGGIESASAYPYTSGTTGQNGPCNFNASAIAAHLTSWKYVTKSQSETAMQQFMTTGGPISICVDASSWSSYTGGIMSQCGTQIDHCVQTVGYNTGGATPYWIVRNSWATSWGIEGYIYLKYGQNTCAMANVPTAVMG